jgi:hypothetical protein
MAAAERLLRAALDDDGPGVLRGLRGLHPRRDGDEEVAVVVGRATEDTVVVKIARAFELVVGEVGARAVIQARIGLAAVYVYTTRAPCARSGGRAGSAIEAALSIDALRQGVTHGGLTAKRARARIVGVAFVHIDA